MTSIDERHKEPVNETMAKEQTYLMQALELTRGSVFSIDGGENWLVVISEPRDGDNNNILFLASPRGNTSLGSTLQLDLDWYDHVWEPDPDALNRGDEFLPVKEIS